MTSSDGLEPISSLVPYVNNYYVQAVVMFMIMAGGLGFMVWVELAEYRKKRRLSLHAKVVLQFSAIFWVGGAVLLALLEWSNPKTMGGLSVPGKLMAALFQSVSTRTAGMNTIDLAACSPISKLLMSVLQFIGAAPGSTGGGVKVTTFAVLILTIRSVAQGRDDCVIGGHHIESKTVYRALTIIVLGAVAAFGSAVVVYYNTGRDGVGHRLHLRVLLGVRYGGPVGGRHGAAEHRRKAAVYGLYVHGPCRPGVAGDQPDGQARRQQAESRSRWATSTWANKKRALCLSRRDRQERPLSLVISCPVRSGALRESPESGRCWGQTASHLPQRTQWLAFSASGEAGRPLLADGVLLAEHPELVPDAEIVRNVHAHGAGHTVAAAGAADPDVAAQDVGSLADGGVLGVGHGAELSEGGEVVAQLVLCTHAGEDDLHIFVAGHPAQRPRGGAGGGGPVRSAARRRPAAAVPACRP